jgi:hypothetical protein
MQNFTLISKSLRKIATNLLIKKLQAKKGAKFEFFLFFTTKLQMFLTNSFLLVHFFVIIFTHLKSAYTHIQ